MAIITTGVKSPNNTIGVRQDLRVMLKDRELMTLYILGLERFQQVDQKDPLSYFQISGIHGRPYIPYDGVGSAGRFGGYCTHSSILFPPWHRPYLALYEQTLAKHVTDIANEYQGTEKAKYVAAAQRFRIPYWDWANDADLPDVVSQQETLTVDAPRGKRTLKNPLYSYTFHPVYSDFGDGLPDEKTWESWQSTVRWPTTTDRTAKSDWARMERGLANNRLTLRDRTYNLLTQANSYEAFSNDGFLGPQSDPRFYDSLESIHGQIHGMAGRNGHMGQVDYAAFDPVFWLHHCNVDRIFALWQAINPTAYVVPRRNDAGTFTTRAGTTENESSPLHPFYQSAGRFWTSATARDTRTFFYTYPELAQWSNLTPAQKSTTIRSEVNKMYGRTAPWSRVDAARFESVAAPRAPAAVTAPKAQVVQQQPTAQKPVAAPKPVVAPVKPAAPAKPVAATSKQAAGDHFEVTGAEGSGEHGHWHDNESRDDDKKHYHEWLANIRVEKYAAKNTFFVHVFLGDFTSDPDKWDEDPNLVGSHVIFANNIAVTGCANCRDADEKHKLVTGTIPLTGALGDRLGAEKEANLEPEEIVPYLRKNLHWRLQKNDGTELKREDIPSLKISVAHAVVVLPNSLDEFPQWGEVTKSSEVTSGRLGGSNDDDD